MDIIPGHSKPLARAGRMAMRQIIQQIAPQPVAPAQPTCDTNQTEFWRGASGRRYAHAVSSLLLCQPMAKSTYILARRTGDRLTVLEIGHLESDADTLNLASIRQRGATLGANEVHLHTLADGEAERARIAFDIEAALELRFPDSQIRRANS